MFVERCLVECMSVLLWSSSVDRGTDIGVIHAEISLKPLYNKTGGPCAYTRDSYKSAVRVFTGTIATGVILHCCFKLGTDDENCSTLVDMFNAVPECICTHVYVVVVGLSWQAVFTVQWSE